MLDRGLDVIGMVKADKKRYLIEERRLTLHHRSHKKEWLAILCTDLTLPEEEIIRIYGIRWDIA